MAHDDERNVGPQSFWARARNEAKKVSDRVAANAADLADAAATASQNVQSSQVFQAARQATDAARARLGSAAADVQEKAREAGETARLVITTLAAAPRHLDDEGALLFDFRTALEPLAGQLDKQAHAVAIGFVNTRGIGLAEVSGTELFYLRPDGPVRGQLRVNSMSGRVARLAIGTSTGAYLACFYGPRDALSRPTQRRGGDVGVLMASIGFFRATATGASQRLTSDDGRHDALAPGVAVTTACGWMVGMSAGLSLGVPILSDLVAFELDEQQRGGFALDRDRSDPLEDIIAQAPDRTRRRQLAQRLL